MKYEKIKDNIIITIPFWEKRINPYMIDENGKPEDVGSYPTLTGLIVRHDKNGNNWEEIGFAYTIDMDYKDKPDQVDGFAVMWDGEEEDFVKLCKEWKIGIHEIKDSDF